jgi:two-component system chemotaxis sensor kinase CheA
MGETKPPTSGIIHKSDSRVTPAGEHPEPASASLEPAGCEERESREAREDSATSGATRPAVEDPSLARLADHLSLAEPASRESKVEALPDEGEPDEEESSEGFGLADDPELIADFIQEATEHLASIESLTLEIEQTPDDRESLNALFRSFHSIKGLAGFLELHAIRELAHQVETLLDLARNGEIQIGGPAIDRILAGADFIRRGVETLSQRLQGVRAPLPPLDKALCAAVADLCRREATPAAPAKEPVARAKEPVAPAKEAGDFASQPASSAIETVPGTGGPGFSAAGSAAFGEGATIPPASAPGAGAMNAAVPAGALRVDTAFGEDKASSEEKTSSGSAKAVASAAASTGSVKVETAKLDYLVDMVGEFVIAQSIVRHDPDLRLAEHPRLQRNFAQLARITAEIQRTAMSMRMVPIQGLFQRMARLVRDLARKTGKDVEFVSIGEETELDRTLIEQLADPLMHMVRNSLDHGLEPAAEREQSGKNPRGRVQLRAAHESGGILIEISDDGRGLSREKILARAIERGLLPGNANPPDAEVWGLIFEPGFSTAEKVTDISGRGVGMDVVRRNIQQLRGRIEVSSVSGQGTSVLLRLPLTLAIIDALLVGVGAHRFILPMYAVREMFRPAAGAVSKVYAREDTGAWDEVVDVRGNLLPVYRLEGFLGVRSRCQDAGQGLLVVLENQSGQFCLLVDEFLGKQEVVIKPLGAMFRNIPGISSGAILGDGKVALILDVDGLLQRKSGAAATHPGSAEAGRREISHG